MLAGIDFELQPETTGDLHLRRQAHQTSLLEAFDAPEVDGVAIPQVFWIAPATAQPDTAPEGVEQATESPEPIGGIPAGVSADALDRLKRFLGLQADAHDA